MTICSFTGKERHASKRIAMQHLRALRKTYKRQRELNVYECRCGGWHMGHNTRGLKLKRTAKVKK